MKKYNLNLGSEQELIIKTDYFAKQANGSVLVQMGGTVVLATAVMSDKDKKGLSFFPLSVEYREKTYAAGKIPGGFFKREGRPHEGEILACREIDRPIRPLFPDWLKREVQISVFVLSYDGINAADTLGMIGASLALSISDIPFDGPVSGVKLVLKDGNWVVNPTFTLEDVSTIINMVGKDENVVMLEGKLEEISDDKFLEGFDEASKAIKKLNEFQQQIKDEIGKEKMAAPEAAPDPLSDELRSKIENTVNEKFMGVYDAPGKFEKMDYLKAIKTGLIEGMDEEEEVDLIKATKNFAEELFKKKMRKRILTDKIRLDNRSPEDIRKITLEVGVLPRVHGSALFTRGETQALVTATLGTSYDEQIVDNIAGDVRKSFMLHYNFPPFSVGEVGFYRSVSRREIGHGHLAEISFNSILPKNEEFPYTLRIVSEILESNGSSSMASVCGGTMAMLDAGVPLKKPVAGVALGLVSCGDDYQILTDILGEEDHWGDMDLKVTGTRDGITAIQMDLKIEGVSKKIFFEALGRAKKGRIHILDLISQTISGPRTDVSEFAPKIVTIKINPDKIGGIIGSGGKTIKAIQEETDSTITIAEDGLVKIFGYDKEKLNSAKAYVKLIAFGPRNGEIYTGPVMRIEKYGVFVELAPGVKGLLHVSQFEEKGYPEKLFKMGQQITAKIKYVNSREGKIDLTQKDMNGEKKPDQG